MDFNLDKVTDRFHVRQIKGQFITFVEQTIVLTVQVRFSVSKSDKVSRFERRPADSHHELQAVLEEESQLSVDVMHP